MRPYLISTLLVAAGLGTMLRAQLNSQANPANVRPHPPGGLLEDQLGTYHTIEGVLYDGRGKVESNTLVVDRVNGNRLDQPLHVLVRGVKLPANRRCVLKGYELGEMIGSPPALRRAATELGNRYEERSAAAWRWRPYFVPLIVKEPPELPVPRAPR